MKSTQGEIIDSIEALCFQESLSYKVLDYLGELAFKKSDEAPGSTCFVDDRCRASMVQWCISLANFCGYSHETTMRTIKCLDCFVSTEDGFQTLWDQNEYQLAAMAVLYTTAKIHEQQSLDPQSLSQLSQGKYSCSAIENMEGRILQALNWHVNPPTSIALANLILDAIEPEESSSWRKNVLAMIDYQIGSVLEDYSYSICKSSSFTVAALLNALHLLHTDYYSLRPSQTEKELKRLSSLDWSEIQRVREGLYTKISLKQRMTPPKPSSIKGAPNLTRLLDQPDDVLHHIKIQDHLSCHGRQLHVI